MTVLKQVWQKDTGQKMCGRRKSKHSLPWAPPVAENFKNSRGAKAWKFLDFDCLCLKNSRRSFMIVASRSAVVPPAPLGSPPLGPSPDFRFCPRFPQTTFRPRPWCPDPPPSGRNLGALTRGGHWKKIWCGEILMLVWRKQSKQESWCGEMEFKPNFPWIF